MEMESQVKRIMQGQVIETAEYANDRKIIGVSDENLVIKPGETECALGKQGAFVKKEEVIETFDAIASIPTEAITETLDFSSSPTPSIDTEPAALESHQESTAETAPANKFILPEASVSDIATGNLVHVESLDSLQTMMPDKPAETITEPVIEEVATEVQLPAMDEKVIAAAPEGVNEALFVNNESASSILPSEGSVELPQNGQEANDNVSLDSSNDVNAGLMKMLEDLQAKLKETEAEIDKFKAELSKTSSDAKTTEMTIAETPGITEIPSTIGSTPESEQQDSLMAAALDQINQISVPELDTPTLEGPTL